MLGCTRLDPLEDTETSMVSFMTPRKTCCTRLDPLEDTETRLAGLGERLEVSLHPSRSVRGY